MNILLIFPGFIIAFAILFYYEYKIRLYKAEPKNKVHFYVARDLDGSLWLYIGKPFRKSIAFHTVSGCWTRLNRREGFEYFGLNEHDYDNLKWDDEPVEVFLNLKN